MPISAKPKASKALSLAKSIRKGASEIQIDETPNQKRTAFGQGPTNTRPQLGGSSGGSTPRTSRASSQASASDPKNAPAESPSKDWPVPIVAQPPVASPLDKYTPKRHQPGWHQSNRPQQERTPPTILVDTTPINTQHPLPYQEYLDGPLPFEYEKDGTRNVNTMPRNGQLDDIEREELWKKKKELERLRQEQADRVQYLTHKVQADQEVFDTALAPALKNRLGRSQAKINAILPQLLNTRQRWAIAAGIDSVYEDRWGNLQNIFNIEQTGLIDMHNELDLYYRELQTGVNNLQELDCELKVLNDAKTRKQAVIDNRSHTLQHATLGLSQEAQEEARYKDELQRQLVQLEHEIASRVKGDSELKPLQRELEIKSDALAAMQDQSKHVFGKFVEAKRKKEAKEHQMEEEILNLLTQEKRLQKLEATKDRTLRYLHDEFSNYGNLPVFPNQLPRDNPLWLNEKLKLLNELRESTEAYQRESSDVASETQGVTLSVLDDAHVTKQRVDDMEARLQGNKERQRILDEIIELKQVLSHNQDESQQLVQNIWDTAHSGKADPQEVEEILSLVEASRIGEEDDDTSMRALDGSILQVAQSSPRHAGELLARVSKAKDIIEEENEKERKARLSEYTLTDVFRKQAVDEDRRNARELKQRMSAQNRSTHLTPTTGSGSTASTAPPSPPSHKHDFETRVGMWKQAKLVESGSPKHYQHGSRARTPSAELVLPADDETIFSDSSFASRATLGQLLQQVLADEEEKAILAKREKEKIRYTQPPPATSAALGY